MSDEEEIDVDAMIEEMEAGGDSAPEYVPPEIHPHDEALGFNVDDEIQKMLDDGIGKDVNVIDDGFSHWDDEVASRWQKRESDTALLLDKWSLRQGRELLGYSEGLKKILEADKRKTKVYQDLELKAADFFSAAFEPLPVLAERCKDEQISTYMRNLLDTPEFQ